MVVGERMNEGAMLYVDIWDDIGLLSAHVFRMIDFAFGRSQLTLQIGGLILFFIQIYYINFISLKHKMFNENNYLPALFYGLLGLTFFNVITLSPQMLGATFILFSINHLFNHVESRNKTDGNILNIGLYVGIAALFYLPLFLMILMHVIGLLFFTNTIFRRYLLLVYGLVVPFILCWLVYVIYGQAGNLVGIFFHSLIDFEKENYLSKQSLFILGGSTILVFTIACIKILLGFGFTIFQVRMQKVMFFASLISLGIFLLYSDKDGYGFVLFFPWMSFFLTHYFLKIRNNLKREMGFLLYFLSIMLLYFGTAYHLFNLGTWVNYDQVLIGSSGTTEEYANQKTLVLGPDIKPYAVSKQATPYFNWHLSRSQLENLEYYDNIEAVNKNIRNDMPEYIIDQVGLAPKIFNQIPLIGEEYSQVESGVYKRAIPRN
jgi:hypothetical protein